MPRLFRFRLVFRRGPIGTTANHPFWSEDRQQFVRADELRRGERLRAFHGTPRVMDVHSRQAPEPVYNLEVEVDHVYHVGTDGILVHNAIPCPKKLTANTLNAAEAAEVQGIANKYNTTVDVVGSRAAGKGRNIGAKLPVGKGPGTRSDIDFRIDTNHPKVLELIQELKNVGNGAGSAGLKHGINQRATRPPIIRFAPAG